MSISSSKMFLLVHRNSNISIFTWWDIYCLCMRILIYTSNPFINQRILQKRYIKISLVGMELENNQMKSSITPVGDQALYKIFGFEDFSFKKAYAPSVVDWSGFYTQLSPEHSMRYLTKKWDDGADLGCIVRLHPINSALKTITVEHSCLSNPHIKGQIKASLIRDHLFNKYEIKVGQEEKLLKFLGDNKFLLKCIDSEEPEIIIPHELLNQNNFKFKTLLSFKKSQDGMLRTIGWRKYGQNHEWNPVKNEQQFQPYLLLKNIQVKQAFSSQSQEIRQM